MLRVPGWSHIYLAIFACVCLSVQQSQSGEAREQANRVAAGMYGWFQLAGVSASSLQKEAKWYQFYQQ